jgi:signal transduction histidine kinase
MMARLMFVDNQYVTITGIIVLYVGLTAAAFGFFISRAITERVRAIATGADHVAHGDFTTRLPVRGNDEIASLTTAFNAMAQALQFTDDEKQRMEKNRRDLIAWVSHDLRTPLATMRVMLEALSDGVISDEATQTRYLKSSLGEIQHLAHLIDDLFELAQLDVGHLQLDYQPISIPDLISDTLSSMLPKAVQKRLTLDGEVDDDVDVVQAAPDKIQRVLYNLVSNAITYTPQGERIRIRARRIPDFMEISVQNSGVVIPPETLPHLFESFYRGDAARAQQNGTERGTGLGLAIARGFVEAHGGRIHATSSVNEGTTFTFTIPL